MYKLYINDTLKGIFANYFELSRELQHWFNCKVTVKHGNAIIKEIYR